MQLLLVCLFLIALLCLIQGLRKSTLTDSTRSFCAGCGWTNEQVRSCKYEQQHRFVVAPLCFDCTLEHEAIPVRDNAVPGYREAYV